MESEESTRGAGDLRELQRAEKDLVPWPSLLICLGLSIAATQCGASRRPEVVVTDPHHSTSVDVPEEAQRLAVVDLVSDRREELVECFVEGILRGGDAEGTIVVDIELDDEGNIDHQSYGPSSTIGSQRAVDCALERIGGWTFPTSDGFRMLHFTLALCRDNSTHSGCGDSANPDFIRVDVTDAEVPHPPSGPPSLDEARNAFENSSHAIEIYWHAMSLARSSSEEAHELLLHWLGEHQIVVALSELELDIEPFAPRHDGDPRSPFRQIFYALRDNQNEVARRSITTMTADRGLIDSPVVDWLLEATVVLRPPSPQVVAFWRAHSRPGDGFINLTVRLLLQNRSEAALQIFAQRIRNRAIESSDKISWIRQSVLLQRLQPEVLAMCLRLLRGGLSPEIRTVLLESLFDFQGRWYPPSGVPTPPSWTDASSETISNMEAIAAYAIDRIPLSQTLTQAIETTLAALRALPRETP